MNSVLVEIQQTKQVLSPSGESVPLHSAISREEGLFLQNIVRAVNPKVSVEIGLAYGVSALYICDAMGVECKHIVIDPHQRTTWQDIGLMNLQRSGYMDKYASVVRFMERRSHHALPDLEQSGTKIDFAFVDGCHLFDFVLVDFFLLNRMLRVGGVIAFDDANMPAIRKVCRFAVTNLGYRVYATSGEDYKPSWKRRLAEWVFGVRSDASLGLKGSCIALEKVKDADRAWDHFTEF